MGCTSDYQKSTIDEVNASKVLALIEELETGKLPKYYGNGYDNKVYNKNAFEILKENTIILCSKLQKIKNVKKYSLELQMWWRDHQIEDKARITKGLKEHKEKSLREKAIAKLTPYERKLLGI